MAPNGGGGHETAEAGQRGGRLSAQRVQRGGDAGRATARAGHRPRLRARPFPRARAAPLRSCAPVGDCRHRRGRVAAAHARRVRLVGARLADLVVQLRDCSRGRIVEYVAGYIGEGTRANNQPCAAVPPRTSSPIPARRLNSSIAAASPPTPTSTHGATHSRRAGPPAPQAPRAPPPPTAGGRRRRPQRAPPWAGRCGRGRRRRPAAGWVADKEDARGVDRV